MYPLLNKKIVCADGFFMSVQANEGAYCDPRINNAEKYTSVEIGYPSHREEIIMPWVEDPASPTDTVYAFVPIGRVNDVIAKHGGIVEGEGPSGVAYLKAPDFLVDTNSER